MGKGVTDGDDQEKLVKSRSNSRGLGSSKSILYPSTGRQKKTLGGLGVVHFFFQNGVKEKERLACEGERPLPLKNVLPGNSQNLKAELTQKN